MKKSAGVKALALAFCVATMMALTVGVAQATTFVWDFSAPNGVVASPHDYFDTTNTYFITATGWNTTNLAPASGTWTLAGVTGNDLFGKFTLGDPGETGLGLAGKPSSEIQPLSLVQLNLSNLIQNGLTDEHILISSVQSGESWAVFNSNTSAANGAQGTFVQGGTGLPTIQTLDISGPITTPYQWITARSGDVLLTDGFAANGVKVPEPTTLLLFGLGLLGLAGIRRKFKK